MKSAENCPIFFANPMIFARGWRNITRSKPSNGLAFTGNRPDAPALPGLKRWTKRCASVGSTVCARPSIRGATKFVSHRVGRPATGARSTFARIKELILDRRVRPVGIKAFQKRMPERSGIYSYENRKTATLSAAATKQFRADIAAWKFFQQQPRPIAKPQFGGWLARSAHKPSKIGWQG